MRRFRFFLADFLNELAYWIAPRQTDRTTPFMHSIMSGANAGTMQPDGSYKYFKWEAGKGFVPLEFPSTR